MNKAVQQKSKAEFEFRGLVNHLSRLGYVALFLALTALVTKSRNGWLLLIGYLLGLALLAWVSVEVRVPPRVVLPVMAFFTTMAVLLLFDRYSKYIAVFPSSIFLAGGLAFLFFTSYKMVKHHQAQLHKFDIYQSVRKEFVDSMYKKSPLKPIVVRTIPMARQVFRDHLVFEKDKTQKYCKVMPSGWLNRSPIQEMFASFHQVGPYCSLSQPNEGSHVYYFDFKNDKRLRRYLAKNHPEIRIDTVFTSTSKGYIAFQIKRH